MPLTLRPYQLAALEASRSKFRQGVRRQLIALPTGTGKTVVFAALRDYFGFKKRVLVLVHREELAQQAVDKIKKWNPTANVGTEMAQYTSSDSDDFVVGSVPTLGRLDSERITKFSPDSFDAVICDEAHHSVADSYKHIFDYFKLLEKDCPRLLLGVTATPNRGDGAALAEVYDEIVYQMSILDAIRGGWLVDMRGVRVSTETKLDGIKTRLGDFQLEDLRQAVNTPYRNGLIVKGWLNNAADRQTVAFTVDIQHAQDLAKVFQDQGIAADAIWGDDPDRARKLALHKEGAIRVLCNCGVLTEGYDDPQIRCIVMARPTKSGLLFTQMAGRGTRLQPDISNLLEARHERLTITKSDCLLMDVVDNTTRHSLVTLSSIFGLGPKTDLKGKSVVDALDEVVKQQKLRPQIDVQNLDSLDDLKARAEHVDLFQIKYPEPVLANSLLQWHQNTDGDSFVLLLPENESVVITKDLLDQYHVVGSVNGNKFQTSERSLTEAFHRADGFVTQFGRNIIHLLRRESAWMEAPATGRQIGFLKRMRIPVPAGLTKGEASRKISQIKARGFIPRAA